MPQQQAVRHSWAPPPDDDDDGDSEPEREPQRRRQSSGGTVVGKKQASPPQASPPTPTSPLSEAAPSSPPTTSKDPWNRGSEVQGVRSPTHGLSTTNSTFRGGFTDVNGSGSAAAAAAAASPALPPAAATPWDGQRVSVRLRPELEGFVFKHNAYNVRRTAILPPQAHSSGAASCDALLSQARNRRGAAANTNGNRNGATAASLSALPQPEAPSSPSSCVVRRYSDFVWLHDVLLKRWPLRLIPPLPPKRLGMPLVAGAASLGGSAADDAFIQRRARGLERYLAALMTHPIVSHDAHLAVFLSDKGSIADWRASHSNPTIVEETMDPRSPSNVNGSRLQQHQAVPKGFDDAAGGKSLDALTNKVVPELLDKWTNLTNVVERMARRHEAQARDSDALAGLIEDVNVSARSGASWAWLGGRRRSNDEGQPGSSATDGQPAATKRIASLHRDLSSLSLLRARQTLGAREQADQSRSQDSSSRDSNDDSATVSPMLPLLERFKMTRDLFLGLRSLLSRHASLAKQLDDEVATLKARIKAGNARLESLRLGNATAATSAEAAREEATKLHEALRRDASRADEVAVRRERARRALWDEVGLVRIRCTEPAIAAVWAGGAGVAGVVAGTSWLEDERKLRGAERLAVEECWRDLRLRDG